MPKSSTGLASTMNRRSRIGGVRPEIRARQEKKVGLPARTPSIAPARAVIGARRSARVAWPVVTPVVDGGEGAGHAAQAGVGGDGAEERLGGDQLGHVGPDRGGVLVEQPLLLEERRGVGAVDVVEQVRPGGSAWR